MNQNDKKKDTYGTYKSVDWRIETTLASRFDRNPELNVSTILKLNLATKDGNLFKEIVKVDPGCLSQVHETLEKALKVANKRKPLKS